VVEVDSLATVSWDVACCCSTLGVSVTILSVITLTVACDLDLVEVALVSGLATSVDVAGASVDS